MAKFYSPTANSGRGGFFDDAVHTNAQMPKDAVPITDADHARLFGPEGQASGKKIVPGPNGLPMLVDAPGPTTEQLWANLRNARDGLLLSSQGLVDRHRDQLDAGSTTSLTAAQFTALQSYRQALRDLPKNTTNPASPVWPTSPI